MPKNHAFGIRSFFVCFLLSFLLFHAPAAKAEEPVTAPAVTAVKKDQDLVLQLFINGMEMQEFIQGLQKGGRLYLPLEQITVLLDFPITIDAANKTAQGWFINDSNKFLLTEKTVTVAGRKSEMPQGSLIPKDGDLFVDAELLQKWFPLDFSADTQSMALNITTRQALPFEEALLRKKTHENLLRQQRTQKDAKFKDIDQPYAALQWPSVDLTFSSSYDSEARAVQSDYSLLAVGDFSYLTGRLYAAGNSDQQMVSDVRLSLGRDDYERHLLGPLRASSFLFGDINSISLNQVTSSGQGRGFTMTNRALDRPDKFDVTSFIGDSKPGWDVELYRNDALIAFQTVDSTGRYAFTDIPVLFGNNIFKLAFYGPQGQREELVKTINADSSLLEKGEFSYNFSADQKLKSLFNVASTAETADSGEPRVAAELEYGVSRWLTAVAGSAYTSVNGRNRAYATAGLHTSFLGMLAGLDTAYDARDGGYSTALTASTRLLDTDIRIQQKIANNFISETDNSSITAETNINLNRGLDFPFFGTVDNGLLLTRRAYDTGRREELVNYRISKSFRGLNLTNTLEYNHDNLGLSELDGTLTLHGAFKKMQIDFQTEYGIKPDRQIDRTRLTLLFPLADGITDNATITKDFSGDGIVQLENTVTFDRPHYRLSLTARADSRRSYFAGFSVNTALGKMPATGNWVVSSKSLAESGTIAIRPFIDRNYNQKYDTGEELLTGVLIKVGGQQAKTDDTGYAMAMQLPTSLPLSVSLNQEVQEDSYAQNKQLNPSLIASNYRIVPRAGRVITVDYPVFETSQLDGIVRVPEGSNPADLQVELINAEGQVVGSTHTAFDGYFLIEGIMPGNYKARIAADSLGREHLRQPAEPPLVIQVSDIYAQDITLEKDE